ncbi:MAG: helix-turn-helix domain-containing protein [Candidatus Eisenbacteria sp.]|nr:helix-turn-helix domain-containing protein [Candidatus Eisenbacteria bacterium]
MSRRLIILHATTAILALVTAAAVAGTDSLAGDPLDLPHRQDRIVIDGDLADWRGPNLKVQLAALDVPAPLQNTGVFQLAWDADHLWFAVTIEDAEVFPPPETAEGATIYQWDSIEIYIDGHGNRSERMDENDTQLIVACNGRHGAMQGDELLRSVDEWEVPKRERLGLAVRTAARRTPSGYIVEGAFPLTAVDVAEARAGQVMALDLAWNDWIEDHPRLPELLKDLENLARLTNYMSESAVELVDPDSLGWDGLLAWEERAYRPHSWCSGPDFGRPKKWQLVRLVGRPPLAEALVDRWGLIPPLVVTFLVLLAAALTVDLWKRRRYRIRVREMMTRIEELSTQTPPSPADPRDWVARVTDRLADVPPETTAASDTISRVLIHVRNHLGENLTVADLAASVGVSLRTLQRACQDELGAPPRDVILAVKMRSAHEALISGKWRVGEVAEQVGFESPYHFSRRFKDFYGKPPSTMIPPR